MTTPNPTPGRPLKAREFFALVDPTAVPYIPEAHRDDCEDTACTRCLPAPLSPEREQEIGKQITRALSEAGAFCGECGFQPGEKGCADCKRCWKWYVKALLPIVRAAVAAERDTQAIKANLLRDKLAGLDDLRIRALDKNDHLRTRIAELERERDTHRAAAEVAEAKLRKIEHGCETPETHNAGCPCDTERADLEAETVALPSEWDCAHGPAEDEPFCEQTEGDGHVCPTIRVHPGDAEAVAAMVERIHQLEKVAVEGRAALADLVQDHEDPGTAALGALYLLSRATTWVDTQPDDADRVLRAHDAKVLRQAAEDPSWGDDDQRKWLAIGVETNLYRLADAAERGDR